MGQQQQNQNTGQAVTLAGQGAQQGAQPGGAATNAGQLQYTGQSGQDSGQASTGDQGQNTGQGAQSGGQVTNTANTGGQAQTGGQSGQDGAQTANTADNAGQAANDAQSGQDNGQSGDPAGDQDGGQDNDQDNGQADGDPVPYHRFKEVNDQLRQARSDLERLPALESENMRLRVALERGIPLTLADRLQGDSVEALNADADSLLAAVGAGANQQTGSPGVPPPSEGSAPEALPDFNRMSPAEIREWSKKTFGA